MVTIKTANITGTRNDVSSVTDTYQTVEYSEDLDVIIILDMQLKLSYTEYYNVWYICYQQSFESGII